MEILLSSLRKKKFRINTNQNTMTVDSERNLKFSTDNDFKTTAITNNGKQSRSLSTSNCLKSACISFVKQRFAVGSLGLADKR